MEEAERQSQSHRRFSRLEDSPVHRLIGTEETIEKFGKVSEISWWRA